MLHLTWSSVEDLSKDDEDEECGDAEGSIEELILFFLVLDWLLPILTVYGILVFDIVLVYIFYKA